jgi:hypothetical protein
MEHVRLAGQKRGSQNHDPDQIHNEDLVDVISPILQINGQNCLHCKTCDYRVDAA